ncbi:MAG: Ig-like domain-containing protein, partial [Clostridia bacterium]|nr:Ig-like domain-containing protein [Clostridia bacterium]
LAAVMALGIVSGAGFNLTLPVLKARAAAPSMTLKRFALELSVGETDRIVPQFKNVTGDTPAVTFTSADSTIVTVDAQGNLEAKKVGKTTVTVACATTGDTIELPVGVIAKEHDYRDQIMLSTFWPPNPASMLNDEQWQLMADAGINAVLGAGAGMDGFENQMKMLELCAKYGIGLTVGAGFAWYTDEELEEKFSYFKNVPSAYGYYFIDEPVSANGYVDRYCEMKDLQSNAYLHLNFLPEFYYGDGHYYRGVLNDYAALIEDRGYELDYLLFDMYPFPLGTGAMDSKRYFSNLRAVLEVAQAHGAAPAAYIQTVCQSVGFRRPSAAEIRYEMYASLAFGCKQLSFFTWFTPVGQAEPFEDGIIDPDGTPNEHYYDIKKINHEILAIGTTLAKCDVIDVYMAGAAYGQPTIPEDYFVQATEGAAIVSHFRHSETGRNYLMVVNNNYKVEKEIRLVFDKRITSLSEVSRVDGSLVPLDMARNTLTLTLAAGDAIFMALPEGVDFYEAPSGQPDELTNLAADGVAYASSSHGMEGWFIYNLNDGERATMGIKGTKFSWSSAADNAPYVKVDFGRTMDFNRVD